MRGGNLVACFVSGVGLGMGGLFWGKVESGSRAGLVDYSAVPPWHLCVALGLEGVSGKKSTKTPASSHPLLEDEGQRAPGTAEASR